VREEKMADYIGDILKPLAKHTTIAEVAR